MFTCKALTHFLRRFSSQSLPNILSTAVWNIPDPAKPNKIGEDAFFLSNRCIAVADGIYWEESEHDFTKYPRELMTHVSDALLSLPAETRFHPQAVMYRAAGRCVSTGGATCCILILDPVQPKVYTANLGDSGYYVLRMNKAKGKAEIVSKSQDVVKYFSQPLYLGMQGSSPDRCAVDVLEVQDQDLVIMYTDGFSFNVFPEQMLSLVQPFLSLPEIPDLEVVAEMLAEKAFKQSQDLIFDSPYAVKAAENMLGQRWEGGKPNDITVIAAQVSIPSRSN